MADPAPNILSVTARHIKGFLQGYLPDTHIDIGPPADSVDTSEDASPTLNLFFYRYDTSGFYADYTSGEPFLIRAHCLISALGNAESQDVSEGELALRLLGHVMQAFHEHPVQWVTFTRNPVSDSQTNNSNINPAAENPTRIDIQEPKIICEGVDIKANLQIIFKTLSLEEINQIWSTQGDAIFRSALAYEFALLPIHPCKSTVTAEEPSEVVVLSALPTAIAPTPTVPEDSRELPKKWVRE